MKKKKAEIIHKKKGEEKGILTKKGGKIFNSRISRNTGTLIFTENS